MQNNNHNGNHNLNPFSPQHPAQSEYFAGRKAEIGSFRQAALNSAKLRIPSPENYAILGTWGLGKTSLLYEYKTIALEDLRNQIKCACIHYSLSPQSCKDWQTFASNFLATVERTEYSNASIKTKVSKEFGKWQLNFNLGVVGGQRNANKRPPDMLESLRDLWHGHLKPAGIDVAFIMLDDFHYFPLVSEDSAYLTLRSVFQELANQKCNYCLVVTAHSNLFTEIAEIAEPLLRFFKRFELKPFTFEETREAVNKRLYASGRKLVVDDKVIQSILDKTGGHPYLVIFSMYELLQVIGNADRVTESKFSGVWPTIEETLGNSIFLEKYRSASEKERELLTEIGESGSDTFSPGDFKRVKGANELFSRLEQKELLLRKSRGNYALFHPLFQEYLRKRGSKG